MYKLLMAAFAVLALAAQPAKAAEKGIYVGADYTYNHFNYQDGTVATGVQFSDIVSEDYNGYAPYIGYKFNKNIALEIGYSGMISDASSKTVSGITYKGDTSYWSVYGDLIGMYPVSESVSLLGSLGYERINVNTDVTVTSGASSATSSTSSDTNAYRFGLGAQWNITDSVGLRGVVRYVATDFSGVDGYIQGTVGLNYTF